MSDTLDVLKKALSDRGICVIIPTYNNESTIVDVVNRTLAQCSDVIVVCDGCTDTTASKLNEIRDIHIVSLPHNKGKGAALIAGFRKAKELGFSFAITLDADGQHFPEDIPTMLAANKQHPNAIIVGSRMELDKVERSAGSKFANSFSNFWFAVQTGHYIDDTQTGYRLYPLNQLYWLPLITSRYESELELLVYASWNGVKIVTTTVSVYYPKKEERVSHFRPAYDFMRISILNTILCVFALIYGYPAKLFRGVRRVIYTTYSLVWFLFLSLCVITPYAFILRIMGMNERRRDSLRKLLHYVAKFVMVWHGVPGTKFKIKSSTECKAPALILCNHQSYFDLMIQLSQYKKVVFLTNDWVWNSPFFGFVIRNAEYYPSSMGYEELEVKIKNIMHRGCSVVIFPEGTRSKDGHIQRFHQGAFKLAQNLKLDILTTFIYGANHILPKGGKLMNSGKMYFETGNRYTFDCYSSMATSTMALTSYFRKLYQQRYDEICNMIERYG